MTEVVPGLTDLTERQREHNVAEALAGIRSSEWTLLPNDLPDIDSSSARTRTRRGR